MSEEKLTASERAARAAAAAHAARRDAARHARARRDEQTRLRRSAPRRVPPGVGDHPSGDPHAMAAAPGSPAAAGGQAESEHADVAQGAATASWALGAGSQVTTPRPTTRVRSTPPRSSRPPVTARARPPAVVPTRAVPGSRAASAAAITVGVAGAPVDEASQTTRAWTPAEAADAASPAAGSSSVATRTAESSLRRPDGAAAPADEDTPSGQRFGLVTGVPTDIPTLPGPPRTSKARAKSRPLGIMPLPDPPRAAPETPETPETSGPSLGTADLDIDLPAGVADEEPTLLPAAADEPDDGLRLPEPPRQDHDDQRRDDTPAVAPHMPEPPRARTAWPSGPTEEMPAAGEDGDPTTSTLPDVTAATDDERPWVRAYPPGVPDTYRYPLVPLSRYLDDGAQDFPDVPAVSFLGSDLSYRELSEQVDRFATGLSTLGLQPGDRLAVVLPLSPQLLVVLNGCWRAGVDPVVLDPGIGAEALTDAIERTGPVALVTIDTSYAGLVAFRDRLRNIRHVISTGLLDSLPAIRARMQSLRLKVAHVQIPPADGVLSLRDVIAEAPPTATQAELDLDLAPALTIVDGDEVRSLSHANLVAASFQARLWIPDVQAGREIVAVVGRPDDVFLIGAGVLMTILAAGTVLIAEPEPGSPARTLDDGRPTLLVINLTHVPALLAPTHRRRDLSSVRVTLCDGHPSDPAVAAAMEQRTAGRFRTSIGSPATGGMVLAQPVYADARPGFGGVPITDSAVGVHEPDGDGNGLLLGSGPQVPGPAGARVSLGVIGAVDEQGRVRLVGPADRVVAHAAGATDPKAVIDVLRRVDGVVDASARAEEGDLVVSVTCRDQQLTAERLEAMLRARLPGQAMPGRWEVVVAAPSASAAPDAAVEAETESEQADAGSETSAAAPEEADGEVQPGDADVGAADAEVQPADAVLADAGAEGDAADVDAEDAGADAEDGDAHAPEDAAADSAGVDGARTGSG